MRIADPDPGQTLMSQKVEFLHEQVKGHCRQNHTYEGTQKQFGRQASFFVDFSQFQCSWIRTHIPNADPDPGLPNQCGSGSTTLKISLKRTVFVSYFQSVSASSVALCTRY
jgi:hypothetical protein